MLKIYNIFELDCKIIQNKYEMSMMDELTYFLNLRVKQVKKGIFINQTKYINDL